MKKCNCVEMQDKNGKYMTIGLARFHDCQYVQKRMNLIPLAAQKIQELYHRNRDGLTGAKFTRLFAAEMEALVEQEGLLS